MNSAATSLVCAWGGVSVPALAPVPGAPESCAEEGTPYSPCLGSHFPTAEEASRVSPARGKGQGTSWTALHLVGQQPTPRTPQSQAGPRVGSGWMGTEAAGWRPPRDWAPTSHPERQMQPVL